MPWMPPQTGMDRLRLYRTRDLHSSILRGADFQARRVRGEPDNEVAPLRERMMWRTQDLPLAAQLPAGALEAAFEQLRREEAEMAIKAGAPMLDAYTSEHSAMCLEEDARDCSSLISEDTSDRHSFISEDSTERHSFISEHGATDVGLSRQMAQAEKEVAALVADKEPAFEVAEDDLSNDVSIYHSSEGTTTSSSISSATNEVQTTTKTQSSERAHSQSKTKSRLAVAATSAKRFLSSKLSAARRACPAPGSRTARLEREHAGMIAIAMERTRRAHASAEGHRGNVRKVSAMDFEQLVPGQPKQAW